MNVGDSGFSLRSLPLGKKEYLYLGVLLFLAVFIWMRDLAWVTTSDDTLPILVALPLFVWLGYPFPFRERFLPFSEKYIIAAALFFLLGIAADSTLLLTVGWLLLLWKFLKATMVECSYPYLHKLMILPLMAFPWVSLDMQQVGWWFRISGANATAFVFTFFNFNVSQEGTLLFINGIPISVEVACAGLNNLQSLLIAGSVVNFILLGDTKRYWLNVPFLLFVAWVANTLRIIMLTFVAIAISPSFAVGWFHTFGGWLILVVMFALSWGVMSLQEPKRTEGYD